MIANIMLESFLATLTIAFCGFILPLHFRKYALRLASLDTDFHAASVSAAPMRCP